MTGSAADTTKRVNQTLISLVSGDITREKVDAIANAANSSLAGGGGVDGAIHRAGGRSIMDELNEIKKRQRGCPTGSAVITGAGTLHARHVIHAVGPRWRGGSDGEAELLASAYRTCMELAAQAGDKSIAFPSISTGIYGYPVEQAAPIALGAIAEFCKQSAALTEVRFVLFDQQTFQAFNRALAELD